MQKQKSKSLSELLHEQQEPFILEEFLSERQHLHKRAGGSLFFPNSDRLTGQHCNSTEPHKKQESSPVRSSLRVIEAAVRILEPGLHACSPSSSATTVRYLVDLDHKANYKKSKRLRKPSRKTQLHCAEQVCVRGHSQNRDCSQPLSTRISSVELEVKNALNAWQRASEALRFTPAKNAADSTIERSLVHYSYSRLFRFNRDNKASGRATEQQGQKNTKYNQLKSILSKLAPRKKGSIKDASTKATYNCNCKCKSIGDGSCTNNIITKDNASSEGFSNFTRSLSRGNHKPDVQQESDQARLRICDIVRWNSFEESEFHDIYVNSRLSNSLRLVGDSRTCKGNAEDGQAFLKRRNDASWDFSFRGSSTSSDCECGSTSLDVFSAIGRSSSSGSRELKRMDSDPFSLEIDDNGKPSDFHAVDMPSTRTQVWDSVCNRHKGSATSQDVETIQKDCMCGSSASIPIPLNLTLETDEVMIPADVKSRSTDIEENKYAPYMDDVTMVSEICSDTDDSSQNDNSEEEDTFEQLSPISVLDSPFEEDTPCFEQSLATIQRARKQLLKKIGEYEQLAHMDPFVLEKKIASWKGSSSENESGSCRDEEYDVPSQTSSRRSYQEEEEEEEEVEMEWEARETEDYVREILSCSEGCSEDPASSTSTWGCYPSSFVEDRKMQSQELARGGSYLKAKQIPMRRAHCKLLFDRVNEELLSTGKHYGSSGFMREVIVKRICGQVTAWEELDTTTHTEKLVELDLKRKGEEWKRFRKEQEEIGMKIEVAIFRVLVEELLVDLLQL